MNPPGGSHPASALHERERPGHFWTDRSIRTKALIVLALPIIAMVGALVVEGRPNLFDIIGLLLALLVGYSGAILLTRSLIQRLGRIEENSKRLEHGEPLEPTPEGRDELARVGLALDHAARLLAQRDASLALSDSRYRALARNFPQGAVAIWDHDLRYTMMEGEVLEAIGLPKEHFEGRTLYEAIDPDVLAKIEPEYRATLAGVRSTTETSNYGRWFLVHRVPLYDQDGAVEAGMLVAVDITDRKKAEEESARARAFLDSVVENLPLMVFVKEADSLQFVRLNRAGEELLGLDRESLIGRSDTDFFPAEQARFFMENDRKVLRSGELVDIPDEPITTTSGERVLHTRKIPILDADGEPRFLLGISEDITQRKADEDELRRAKAEAERANSAKDEFLSRMSHELRTPMNAVLGFAQILEMDGLAGDQAESVRQILRGGRHLLDLINEVLDIARISAGTLSLSTEAVPVCDVVVETVDLVRPLAAERGIALAVDGDGCEHVRADHQRLKQILLNLLSNAVKYNRPNGSVRIGWVERDDRIRLTVADTGPGIEQEAVERLFVPFDRLGAERDGIEGTGLGLALTKALVEAMGGTIGVSTEMGVGTTFWFELGVADAPADEVAEEVVSRTTTDAARRTLLYVEDNPSNLQLVQRILDRRPEFRVISAAQGSIALELARQHLPDVILLDLHLPDMPGTDVLRTLRDDPTTQTIPVVVISADATETSVRSLTSQGAAAYLTKPLDVRRFLQTLDDVCTSMVESHTARSTLSDV
jgi:PAS domain S-box-containing protein